MQPKWYIEMSGNTTSENISVGTNAITIRAGTLVLMQCFIIPGNALILLAISKFKTKAVSDILIGCLALTDLMNGIGPVSISIAMYLSHPKGFNGIDGIQWLCSLYTWMSCALRLMACFTATLMSMDRFIAIVIPFHYRTRVTPKIAYLLLLGLLIFSIAVGVLPILGVSRINVLGPMCSFDFTGPFAVFIAVLGYFQILIVIICYVSVMLEINAFLSRQTLLKASQLRASFASKSRQSSKRDNTGGDTTHSARFNQYSPLSVRSVSRQRLPIINDTAAQRKSRSSSLMPGQTEHQIMTCLQAGRSRSWTPITANRSSFPYSIRSKNTRSHSLSPNFIKKQRMSPFLVRSRDGPNDLQNDPIYESIYNSKKEEELNEAKVQSSLRDFKRNHTTWKQSRKLAVVMGIVVVLFYISWLPIVVIITASLLSKSTSQALHFAAARLSLVSSMLNFLVYGGMLKQYRQAYKAILKRICCCGENTSKRPQSKVQTKTRRQKWRTTSSDNKEEGNGDKKKRVRFKKTINAIAPLIELNNVNMQKN